MARTRKGTAAGWDALKPDYRQRLLKRGYTRSDYLAGVSRKAARGHGTTPERPSRVRGREGEFRDYLQRQAKGITTARRTALADKIYYWYLPDLDARRIRSIDRSEIDFNIGNMPPAQFLKAEQLTQNEWREMASFMASDRTSQNIRDAMLSEWEYGMYDDESGHWVNPFWYH